ncbi:MAG: hypothetical protein JXO49_09195 [Deltaproteobacteria bacterium]|nr:hypothetical protein [Candidatus Anaeroferrophillus wilburensis]MBN2889505.1 hypothetical protein [Deltaproteobacteria bacterium]
MMENSKPRYMFFVSTGRCGTKRIAEILRQVLPSEYSVMHQTTYARLANVLGNIQYHLPLLACFSEPLYRFIIEKNSRPGNHIISTDPLTSMIIPEALVRSSRTAIIHIVRDEDDFARSLYRLTRTRKKSFIAHNMIPFWQPLLWPLENLTSKAIIDKYRVIHRLKNDYFLRKYAKNPHYQRVTMSQLFSDDVLSQFITDFFKITLKISATELETKANATLP